ncbi:MAG: adenylyl-sulfate kinase [Myxococcota bacterium]
MERRATNVVWHHGLVDPDERAALLGHQGAVVWFTGLSGSGKSTVAREVERLLLHQQVAVCVLDGDNLRHGLNADLGFSPADRTENIRRVGAVAQLISQSGLLCLAAFVSPYRADRQLVRERVGPGQFIEVFVNTPIEVCEARDPKGLYAKARRGEIKDFTGISAPYEAPESPEIIVGATAEPAIDSAIFVLAELAERGLIPPRADHR